MFTVEKMNGVYLVMKNGNEMINAHRLKRDANAEAFYLNQTTMKTVTVLGSGKQIQIPVGTPHCCDPSTETYWSM
jgi:3-dehydroquinate synthase class II